MYIFKILMRNKKFLCMKKYHVSLYNNLAKNSFNINIYGIIVAKNKNNTTNNHVKKTFVYTNNNSIYNKNNNKLSDFCFLCFGNCLVK